MTHPHLSQHVVSGTTTSEALITVSWRLNYCGVCGGAAPDCNAASGPGQAHAGHSVSRKMVFPVTKQKEQNRTELMDLVARSDESHR